jgi:hypothetical protein
MDVFLFTKNVNGLSDVIRQQHGQGLGNSETSKDLTNHQSPENSVCTFGVCISLKGNNPHEGDEGKELGHPEPEA